MILSNSFYPLPIPPMPKIKWFTVTFWEPVHNDYMEAVKEAIMLIKWVVSVDPVEENMSDQIDRKIIRNEIVKRLLNDL